MAAFFGGVARPTELEEATGVPCSKESFRLRERNDGRRRTKRERERVEAGPSQWGRWDAVQVAGSISSNDARR